MRGYVIAHAEITDEELFADFIARQPASLAAHGGKFVVRTGAVEVVQGDWNPQRIAVMEFPDVEQARAWQASPDYAPLRALLDKCCNVNVIIVEGDD